MKLADHRILTIFVLGIAISCGLIQQQTQADQRRFAYSYETLTYVPGNVEFETWMTWKDRDGGDRFDFRNEIEIGLSEKLRFSFYFADWRYESGTGSTFHDVGVEVIYNLTNPNTDCIGSSLYFEVLGGEEFLEAEGKILLQKNFGPFAIVYNAVLEAEWEGKDLHEAKGEIGNTLGVNYMLSQTCGIGAELLTETEIAEWEEFEDIAVYLGPNATFRKGNVWLTLAGLWELTETGEPDFQLRTICGLHF